MILDPQEEMAFKSNFPLLLLIRLLQYLDPETSLYVCLNQSIEPSFEISMS